MELVERGEEVVCELDFGECGVSLGSETDGEADDSLLSERGVEDALAAEAFREAHGAAEDAAEGDVFAEYAGFFVGGEDGGEGVVDGLEEVHAFCFRGCAEGGGELWIGEGSGGGVREAVGVNGARVRGWSGLLGGCSIVYGDVQFPLSKAAVVVALPGGGGGEGSCEPP